MLNLQARAREACDALQRALQLDSAHLGARVVLAGAQTSIGEVAAAAGNYRQALSLQPASWKAWLGSANLNTVRFDKKETIRLQRATE